MGIQGSAAAAATAFSSLPALPATAGLSVCCPRLHFAQDRVVAVRRPWPSESEGPGLEPPSSICQTSACSSGPGATAVSAAAGLLGRGLAAAVNGGSGLLRGSTTSSGGGGASGAGTPRGGTPKAAAAAAAAAWPSYQLFAAFDGHNGAEAARFAEHSIVPIVEIFLPPWSALSLFPTEPAELAAQLQQALALAFLELHRQFAMAGCLGGTTATVVLQVRMVLGRWLAVEVEQSGEAACTTRCVCNLLAMHAAQV